MKHLQYNIWKIVHQRGTNQDVVNEYFFKVFEFFIIYKNCYNFIEDLYLVVAKAINHYHSGFLKVRILLYFRDFCYVTQLKQGKKLTFEVTPGDT